MKATPQKYINDITEIFIDFLKAPLQFLKSDFHRKSRTLVLYAAIIFFAIGLLGMGLSLLDGLDDVLGLLRAVLMGSLIAYAHLATICFLIYLFFKHALGENKSHSEWFSTFFLASMPFWVACVVMNFLTRAVMAFSGGGIALIFYSYVFMELLRLAGLLYVLQHRFPRQKKNILTWAVVLVIFIAVNYPKIADSYSMLSFDLNSLPPQ